MGGPAFGGGPAHLVCVALGYLCKSWFGAGISAGRRGNQHGGDRCAEACRVDCSVNQNHFDIKFYWGIALTLFSIVGRLLLLLRWL